LEDTDGLLMVKTEEQDADGSGMGIGSGWGKVKAELAEEEERGDVWQEERGCTGDLAAKLREMTAKAEEKRRLAAEADEAAFKLVDEWRPIATKSEVKYESTPKDFVKSEVKNEMKNESTPKPAEIYREKKRQEASLRDTRCKAICVIKHALRKSGAQADGRPFTPKDWDTVFRPQLGPYLDFLLSRPDQFCVQEGGAPGLFTVQVVATNETVVAPEWGAWKKGKGDKGKGDKGKKYSTGGAAPWSRKWEVKDENKGPWKRKWEGTDEDKAALCSEVPWKRKWEGKDKNDSKALASSWKKPWEVKDELHEPEASGPARWRLAGPAPRTSQPPLPAFASTLQRTGQARPVFSSNAGSPGLPVLRPPGWSKVLPVLRPHGFAKEEAEEQPEFSPGQGRLAGRPPTWGGAGGASARSSSWVASPVASVHPSSWEDKLRAELTESIQELKASEREAEVQEDLDKQEEDPPLPPRRPPSAPTAQLPQPGGSLGREGREDRRDEAAFEEEEEAFRQAAEEAEALLLAEGEAEEEAREELQWYASQQEAARADEETKDWRVVSPWELLKS